MKDRLLEEAVERGELSQYLDYMNKNRRASLGLQAHDYCWAVKVGQPGCISCGCSEHGPCSNHRPLKPPVAP
jgi:hypothetical protein